MPWIPELFTAQAAQHVVDRARIERRAAVPYFEGLLTGDTEALIGSFAGEPELYHPVRGRVKGAAAFADFVAAQRAWLTHCGVEAEQLGSDDLLSGAECRAAGDLATTARVRFLSMVPR